MIISCMELGDMSGHDRGRYLLRKCYRFATGNCLPEVAVTERGKPYFVNDPRYFSISHTKRRAFCVLTYNPVGIDAEEIDRNINLCLAEKILSPAEKAQFDAAADKRLALLKFWVLKEAAAKLSGEGLRGYPNHTNFSLDDPRVFEMENCLVAILTK